VLDFSYTVEKEIKKKRNQKKKSKKEIKKRNQLNIHDANYKTGGLKCLAE
jgi:translation initiation factor IF-3